MELTFDHVDDLGFAAKRGLSVAAHVSQVNAVELGPCFEYLWMRRRLALPSLRIAPRTAVLDCIARFIESSTQESTNLSVNQACAIEIVRVPQEPGSLVWTTFLRRVQIAAQNSGHDRQIAAGIAGAVGEMASNAIEHSGRPRSAVMAYRVEASTFEFVVADAGIGLRASLQQCPEFADITDSGEALALCIQEGVSRHGVGVGRGNGFSEVFRAVATLDATVRLRSEDHALTIRGHGIGPSGGVQTCRPEIAGFFISVRTNPQDSGVVGLTGP